MGAMFSYPNDGQSLSPKESTFAQTQSTAISKDRQKRILLIEQDIANALLIQSLLTEEGGYDVWWVRSPMEAFATLELTPGVMGQPRWQASLIVLDTSTMDEPDRFFMRHTIELHRDWPPAIMLSSMDLASVEHTLDGISVHEVVAKPFELSSLLESVRAVLEPRDD